MTSCATSVCHGGNAVIQPRSEATTWLAVDPHARAYDTLLSADSRKMAALLWPGQQRAAHREARCLQCHVHPDYQTARPSFRLQDGVSCESCHGAAQHWLAPHYRGDWKKVGGKTKQDLGLADTKNLAVRAGACVGCHVGAPGTDAHVDHDLIAAGHPALRFEFATYSANLPAHWNVKMDQARNSSNTALDFEARAWAVGQLVTSARALELLAGRTTGDGWPDFAELDCFACHHDLRALSWRRKEPPPANRKPGDLLWNNWHYALLPDLLPESKPVQSFKQGRDRIKRSDLFTNQGRTAVALHARQLAQTLSAMAKTRADVSQPDPCFSLAWLNRLSKGRAPDRSWDEATQRYFALLAARQMHPDAHVEPLIAELGNEVIFRTGSSGPSDEKKK